VIRFAPAVVFADDGRVGIDARQQCPRRHRAPDSLRQLRLNARNEGLLVLSATGADQEALAAVQRILSEHVERFGRREGLSAAWGPASEIASPD
jgi:Uncharacterized protein conserved in bacteria (DUF2218)